jgi:hypothetical protein
MLALLDPHVVKIKQKPCNNTGRFRTSIHVVIQIFLAMCIHTVQKFTSVRFYMSNYTKHNIASFSARLQSIT